MVDLNLFAVRQETISLDDCLDFIRDLKMHSLVNRIISTQKEQGDTIWDSDFRYRVIDEYKRYLELCIRCPYETLVPSRAVDFIWHADMHRNRRSITRRLQHKSIWSRYPYLGIPRRKPHMTNGWLLSAELEAYWKCTLANYQETFKQSPPRDIWDFRTKYRPCPAFRDRDIDISDDGLIRSL